MSEIVPVNKLITREWLDSVMHNKSPEATVVVGLSDGTFTLNIKVAVMHSILWSPLKHYKFRISSKDIYFGYKDTKTVCLNNGTISDILTKQYYAILEKHKYKIDHQDVLLIMSRVTNDLWNFVRQYLSEFSQTISSSRLYGLLKNKKVAKIVNTPLNTDQGSKACEVQLDSLNKKLITVLSTRGEIPNNPLINFMETKVLKPNIISQMLIAYGGRSDIEDSMMNHIITRSSLQGLRTPADYAVEYLSAKKSMWFTKKVIRNTQYSARKHKLLCSGIKYIYPGDCGTPLTVPMFLKKDFRKGWLYKDIVDNGKIVTLTPDVIDKYLDTTVEFKSLTVCRHTDGFCEACAGRNHGRSICTFPKNFHPGFAASSEIGGNTVSQLILSTKHLITTDSVSYILPEKAKMFFMQSHEGVTINKKAEKNLRHLYIRIPLKSIGPLTDLELPQLPSSTLYSQIDNIEILHEKKRGEFTATLINMVNNDKFFPHLSDDFLKHMQDNLDKITVDDKVAMIPMNKWDPEKNMFDFAVVNDDMVAYAQKISKFTSTEIRNHTSLTDALTAYTNILYQKAQPNFFYVEIMLRALMITEPEVDYNIPVVHDPTDVCFGSLSKVISGRSVAVKMGFEDMGRYLQDPKTYLTKKPGGVYDPLFGVLN